MGTEQRSSVQGTEKRHNLGWRRDDPESSDKLERFLDGGKATRFQPKYAMPSAGDRFGAAVSLDGNRLAIGAPDDDGVTDGLGDSGAVYLFTFADANFGGATLQATIGHGYVGGKHLFVTQIDANDNFGSAVSLDGNRLAVFHQ